MILAGDVGGTKVHLALYDFAGNKLKELHNRKYRAHDFTSLEAVISGFFELHEVNPKDVTGACFGCPEPTNAGRVSLTNLPWHIEAGTLEANLGITHTYLINDLEANAYGIPELTPTHLSTLYEGSPSAIGNCGLIAAGTGLGEALLFLDSQGQHIPISSEGGHCDFAPRNEREDALLKFLRGSSGEHISFERVVSGIGIVNIYTFLRDVEHMEEPHWLRERMKDEDPNAVIGECAENGLSSLCMETLEMFSSAYGAEAGNIALKMKTLGGMYLGGGIAPKILKTLGNGSFLKAFLDKGRLSSLMELIPVHVITDESCALLGAAAYARLRLMADRRRETVENISY